MTSSPSRDKMIRMNSPELSSSDAIDSVEQICNYYSAISEKNEDLKTGIEWERFAVTTDDLQVVPYDGDPGYQTVMQFLHQKKGWHIEEEEDGWIFSLLRSTSRITIEGDGRPEISAAAFPSLHVVGREIEQHKREMDHISREEGISWIPMGYHPYASPDEIPIIPKKRYELLNRLFPDHEEWIKNYLRSLSGTHLNFGYTSGENLITKLKVLYLLCPMLSALYACSPFEMGKKTQYQGVRRQKFLVGGPGQEKMTPGLLAEDFSVEDLINWYVDQPIVYIKGYGGDMLPSGMTFRDYMKNGYKDKRATFFDFDQHIKTRWTDVRLRPSYLELRVFDSVPYQHLMASAAFVKGLIFDRHGWWAVQDLTKDWTEEDVTKANLEVCEKGIHTEIKGLSMIDMARQLFSVANNNLKGFDRQNEQGDDERIFLGPLERLIEKEQSVSDQLLEYTEGDSKKIIEWSNQEF